MSLECFPRLSPFVAKSIWKDLISMEEEGQALDFSFEHIGSHYTATGGRPVDLQRLQELRGDIVKIASASGFPSFNANRTRFDLECSRFLTEQAEIPFPEASRRDMWPFFTLVLLPDVAQWRFPLKTEERWFHGIRNTFGILWRRGYLIGAEIKGIDAGWRYLERLTQDAMVALFERSSFAANPLMARAVASVWVEFCDELGQSEMQAITRQAMKNLVAYRRVYDLDSLGFDEMRVWAATAFKKSAQLLGYR